MSATLRHTSICLLLAGFAVAAQAQQAAAPAAPGAAPAAAPPAPMGFFITSTGPGKGGDLGGLTGADAHCQKLASAAGAGSRTWKAYLSTSTVNARDRIGPGPWANAKGEIVAKNVAELHGDVDRDRNNLWKGSALDEKGNTISGRGDTPNRHDILTGSDSLGRAAKGPEDMSCRNWTSSKETDGAMVGHHDRNGGGNTSWNSAHRSRGCTQDQLKATGGDGLLYCFAEK